MSCLDDDTVLRMIEGALAPPALVAADAHLDGCATCRDLLAQVARNQAPAAAGVLARGQVIGRYVVGDLLGTGAMGRVYSAWEPELDRRVALKVLRDDTGAVDGARQRMVREAQAMARLAHANVVTVHEVGTVGDAVYVAMELVDGDTLRMWARAESIDFGPQRSKDRNHLAARAPLAGGEARRPWREVAAVLVEIARGLAAVHAAGVVHRDIKPDNIIVGADGRARLGDFGLARARAGPDVTASAEQRAAVAASAATAATMFAAGTPSTTGAVAGTPAYMAPEVLRGGAADAAADQFSFGVTAWELLHGTRPFAGKTWGELLAATQAGAIRPASARVPGWLDALVRRCLAAAPSTRFRSMTAVADSLAAGLVRRRRPAAWITAGLASVLALAVGYVASTRDAASRCGDTRRELDALVLPGLDEPTLRGVTAWKQSWAQVREATCRRPGPDGGATANRCLDQRRAELAALFERIQDDPVPAGRSPARARLIDALAALPPIAECAAARAGAADPKPLDPDNAERVRAVEAALPALRAAVALGDARTVLARSAEIGEVARASGHHPTVAIALLVRAEVERVAGQLDAATISARDAAAAAERGHDDATAAEAWLERAIVAGDGRELDSADDLATIADAMIARAGGKDHLVTRLLEVRGKIAYNRGHLVQARSLLAEALLRETARGGPPTIELARLYSSRGQVERAADRLPEAEQYLRLALDLDRELRGPSHPQIALDLHNIAGVLRRKPDLAGALALYREALAIDEATGGADSIAAGLTHNSLGLIYMARGDWATARTELTRAREILARSGHADVAMAEHNLGLVAQSTGDHRAAVDHFARAARIYTRTIGNSAPQAVRLVDDRAVSERALAGRARATPRTQRPVDVTVPIVETGVVDSVPAAPPASPPTVTPDANPRRKDVGVYGSTAQSF